MQAHADPSASSVGVAAAGGAAGAVPELVQKLIDAVYEKPFQEERLRAVVEESLKDGTAGAWAWFGRFTRVKYYDRLEKPSKAEGALSTLRKWTKYLQPWLRHAHLEELSIAQEHPELCLEGAVLDAQKLLPKGLAAIRRYRASGDKVMEQQVISHLESQLKAGYCVAHATFGGTFPEPKIEMDLARCLGLCAEPPGAEPAEEERKPYIAHFMSAKAGVQSDYLMFKRYTEEEDVKDAGWLGVGGFGVVAAAYSIKQGSLVALKLMKLTNTPEEQARRCRKEFRLHSSFDHRNIVKMLDNIDVLDTSGKPTMAMVMELCLGGTLRHYVRRWGQPEGPPRFQPADVRVLSKQIAEGLKYLHNHCVVHRDVKFDNVLVDDANKPPREVVLKLSDFGESRELETTEDQCKTVVGTRRYLAPEVQTGRGYDYSCDIWSFGLVIYQLASGQLPFGLHQYPKIDAAQWHHAIQSRLEFTGWSSEYDACRDLVRDMLVVDACLRIPILNVVNHRFLVGDDSGDDDDEAAADAAIDGQSSAPATLRSADWGVQDLGKTILEASRGVQVERGAGTTDKSTSGAAAARPQATPEVNWDKFFHDTERLPDSDSYELVDHELGNNRAVDKDGRPLSPVSSSEGRRDPCTLEPLRARLAPGGAAPLTANPLRHILSFLPPRVEKGEEESALDKLALVSKGMRRAVEDPRLWCEIFQRPHTRDGFGCVPRYLKRAGLVGAHGAGEITGRQLHTLLRRQPRECMYCEQKIVFGFRRPCPGHTGKRVCDRDAAAAERGWRAGCCLRGEKEKCGVPHICVAKLPQVGGVDTGEQLRKGSWRCMTAFSALAKLGAVRGIESVNKVAVLTFTCGVQVPLAMVIELLVPGREIFGPDAVRAAIDGGCRGVIRAIAPEQIAWDATMTGQSLMHPTMFPGSIAAGGGHQEYAPG
eukprot:TRINITY_DN12003_c0_g1_i1.p1 TRINITY_DN12003_c0_g1~~TRINITY_DN12003_c0_g1_i1.p1  ORF type:complete len:953 (+),score=187.73 TRINITY_DN12003_c0_g1_i1:66-2861(+)